jgi:hypothetical protein
MKFTMIGQEKNTGDCLIGVTSWAGLTLDLKLNRHFSIESSQLKQRTSFTLRLLLCFGIILLSVCSVEIDKNFEIYFLSNVFS